MADDVEPFGILVGDDRDVGIAIDAIRRIDDLAVDLAGERGLGEAGADGRRDLGDGDGRVEVSDGAVG